MLIKTINLSLSSHPFLPCTHTVIIHFPVSIHGTTIFLPPNVESSYLDRNFGIRQPPEAKLWSSQLTLSQLLNLSAPHFFCLHDRDNSVLLTPFLRDHNTCRHPWRALASLSPGPSTFLSILLISSLPSPFLFIFIPTLSLWHSLSTVSNYISQCSTFLVANPSSTLLINKTKTKRTFLFCTPGFCHKNNIPLPSSCKACTNVNVPAAWITG